VEAIADLDRVLKYGSSDAPGGSAILRIYGTNPEQGERFLRLQQAEKAIADYDAALEILGRLERESRLPVLNTLARVHKQRGVAYSDMGRPERAIADFDRALEIRERMEADGTLADRNRPRERVVEKIGVPRIWISRILNALSPTTIAH
jgi:tetratricopeptide (TPR) repeat protein